MNFYEEALALLQRWVGGEKAAVVLSLKGWDGLAASAVCAQFVLLLLDETDDLPEFVEMLEAAAFDDSELNIGEVMEE